MIYFQMMRYVFIAVILLSLGSCCTKKNCDDNIPQQVQLRNFNTTAIDTVILKVYSRNTGFMTPVASYLSHGFSDPARPPFMFANFPVEFDVYHDYRIEMPSLNKTYDLNEINYGKEVCNDCLLFWHSYYEELKSYQVNGNRQFANFIYISM